MTALAPVQKLGTRKAMRSPAQIARRVRQRLLARLSRPSWVRRPAAAGVDRLCILACYAARGRIADRVFDIARAWRREGYVVVLVVASEHPETIGWDSDWADACDGLIARKNHGYDFGSWSAALRTLPRRWQPSLLALANDSVYGPLNGFGKILARVAACDADVVGLTDSYDYWHHVQSYLTFYKPSALHSRAFRRFWSTPWAGDRGDIIWHAELQLLRRMEAGGLRVAILFPSPEDSTVSPTLLQWRELIAAGFPFVKVQLLRDNPHHADIDGWERVLAGAGFNPADVVRDLGERYAASAAGHASTG